MKVLRNEKGYVKFVFTVLVIGLLVYTGIQFGIPYYKYSAFKTDAKDITRLSLENVAKTRGILFERAKELKIPIEEEDISVVNMGKTVRVKISWSETVDLLGLYQKQLEFTVDIEE